MTSRIKTSTRALLTSGLVMGGLIFSLAAAALVKPSTQLPLKLTSFTVNLGVSNLPRYRSLGIGDRRRTGLVEIGIDRWSPDGQLDELLDTLRTRGADKMLGDLQKAPRVGYLRTPDHVGWDIHFASVSPTEDGGEKIVLATDRPIRFWESANLTRTLRYPFTLIEIHLDKNGRGEGRMSVATKITLSRDGRTLELENYSSQPVMLKKVAVQS
jgi:hypothetical protein